MLEWVRDSKHCWGYLGFLTQCLQADYLIQCLQAAFRTLPPVVAFGNVKDSLLISFKSDN